MRVEEAMQQINRNCHSDENSAVLSDKNRKRSADQLT